ncbi:ergothioneine biosynthesis protein EgtB [Sphingobium yanoikuyae]|uniref:Ergothioneine biosynthesis protein EgtB n=1 Tax=Sphingobium yanoikuyae TaxID=13690 RepID=A0AA42WVS9_SPHYA|nr:ergothioneine biosynthesis protein EgtB [Sphingobium yanoikuyae]MDH2131583.1 ergothioneine biosynthesis protein EgtB [Sphingobium yanoikuyae]MDH2148582.1 ergothioneine biosynthesis protein EgtB [Sphingobium yanoikuyae]MDH2167284.1 ergothioneine biosynthesis protein EgtB [Sphingobium yanoikuyae]
MAKIWIQPGQDALAERYRAVRALTQALAAPLSDADATVQSMPDASPAKWHLAHVSWFFETFVLRDHVEGYRPFDDSFAYLFNSYYEAEGPRHARPMRGMLTRPSLNEVRAYRAHVDAALLAAMPHLPEAACTLVTLGLQHEQQHQELLLTDLQHLFSLNPIAPALFDAPRAMPAPVPGPLHWIEGREGLVEIGDDGKAGFAFDCEGPRHKVFLRPHALAHRPITNGEWVSFIEDGGYRDPALWLSDGWAWVQAEGIEAPLYWQRGEKGWTRFGLDGRQPVNPAAPACHISLYEADAYASWAGARLPTEAEWESAALNIAPTSGEQLDGTACPRPRAAEDGTSLTQMFGDVWEWTGSAYRPYPGFRTAPGAVGEYNGKFMSGQFVLKGGSCATPRGHVRASYRNFFHPHQRWQFTGLRLAKDL